MFRALTAHGVMLEPQVRSISAAGHGSTSTCGSDCAIRGRGGSRHVARWAAGSAAGQVARPSADADRLGGRRVTDEDLEQRFTLDRGRFGRDPPAPSGGLIGARQVAWRSLAARHVVDPTPRIFGQSEFLHQRRCDKSFCPENRTDQRALATTGRSVGPPSSVELDGVHRGPLGGATGRGRRGPGRWRRRRRRSR